jgi:bifunctional non-homologous end joining protein LigD
LFIAVVTKFFLGGFGGKLLRARVMRSTLKLSTGDLMQPTLRKLPFSGASWLFEPKWDGFRAVCYLEGETVRFVSRNNRSLTDRFPELQSIVAEVRADSAVFDGEIVALDRKGIPVFDALRSRKRDGVVVVFYAFDLLCVDGCTLMNERLIDRKRALRKILSKGAVGRVRYTEHVLRDGEALFVELERRGLEGMVAKRVDSLYVGGRTQAWLKIKTGAGRDEMRRRSRSWR